MAFFTEQQEAQIVAAIQAAEKQTSGEIRVHVEGKTGSKSSYDRAVEVFENLNMHQTEARNGILFYVATKDHAFSLIGDLGIHEKVGGSFWEEVRDHVIEEFKKGDFTQGLCRGIAEAGEQLKAHFPYQSDDVNELPDDISKGEL
ncbi:MAG: TPM domain-containing protein [Schleiferiaceae bacterium]